MQPWKNGVGETKQIFIYPPTADFVKGESFLLRVSSAHVLANGEWSKFPGYTRHLMVLEGRGVQLAHEGGGQTDVLNRFEMKSFSGDLETRARLVAGSILDLNVIHDTARVTAAVDVYRPEANMSAFASLMNPYHFFYCVEGNVAVAYNGKHNAAKGATSGHRRSEPKPFTLEKQHGLWLEAEEGHPEEMGGGLRFTSTAPFVLVGVTFYLKGL